MLEEILEADNYDIKQDRRMLHRVKFNYPILKGELGTDVMLKLNSMNLRDTKIDRQKDSETGKWFYQCSVTTKRIKSELLSTAEVA